MTLCVTSSSDPKDARGRVVPPAERADAAGPPQGVNPPEAMDPEALAALGPSLEAPEELTEEDLRARASLSFALDLEAVLPGQPVGSELVLLETDPEAARRMGVRLPAPGELLPEPPPPPAPLSSDGPSLELDVELAAPGPPEGALSMGQDLPLFVPPDLPLMDGPPDLPPPPSMSGAEFPAPAPPPPPLTAQAPLTAPAFSPPRAAPVPPPAHADRLQPGTRRWPLAFSFAGLRDNPLCGTPRHARPPLSAQTPPAAGHAPAGLSHAETLLDLAAVGTAPDGVWEMLLMFKEDVLRGLVCRLRMEPAGMKAVFVAPDETVRRYVESTAENLLGRMRAHGLKVSGYTVEVGR